MTATAATGFVCACALWVGCSALRTDLVEEPRPAGTTSGLPAPKRDPSATVLDVAFVSIVKEEESQVATEPHATLLSSESTPSPELRRSSVGELWRWIDETAIAPETRAALRQNGIRVGRVHTKSEFTRTLSAIRRAPQDEATKLLNSAAVGSDLSHASSRYPCRMGKRHELPVRNPAPGEVATLVSLGGSTIGKTLSTPQPIFALTVKSFDAFGVRLQMQPEIQYGTMRQTWVGSDSALRIDNRRESWQLEPLGFELTSEKGGMIVVGATTPAFGLGQQMFTGTTADGDVDHVVMVLTVASIPELLGKP